MEIDDLVRRLAYQGARRAPLGWAIAYARSSGYATVEEFRIVVDHVMRRWWL